VFEHGERFGVEPGQDGSRARPARSTGELGCINEIGSMGASITTVSRQNFLRARIVLNHNK
jgi:hypothetical protein